MASYFDVKPTTKSTADPLDLAYGDSSDGLGRCSILTPQVSSILDDLGHLSGEEESDSDSDSDPTKQEETIDENRKPIQDSAEQEQQPPENPAVSSLRPTESKDKGAAQPRRHPRLDRFVSLRSTLLSAQTADKMSKAGEPECRPDDGHGPSAGEGRPRKESFAHRVGSKLRRFTSKDVPTMANIREHSSQVIEDGDAVTPGSHKKRDSGHAISDDDELSRWTSHTDPPSGEDARPKRESELSPFDTGPQEPTEKPRHESLKPEDVDELVKWVSRKSDSKNAAKIPTIEVDPSEPSTQSDTNDGELCDNDVDEILKWVGRNRDINSEFVQERHLAATGPLAQHRPRNFSHVPPLTEQEAELGTVEHAVLHDEDPRGRRLSQMPSDQYSMTTQAESNLEEEDVAGLIRTVTRDECSLDDEKRREAAILRWKIERDRQEKLGKVDKEHQGELTEEDVDELVRWVSKK